METETPYETYDRSLERLVMIDEPVAEQVRAAFDAGLVAGVLQTLDDRLVPASADQ